MELELELAIREWQKITLARALPSFMSPARFRLPLD
jgi:hypothetical protein